MALHNSIVYNAAIAAFIAAPFNSPAVSNLPWTATFIAQATAFAEAVDTAIVNDSSISDGTGEALQPSTQLIIQAQFAVNDAAYACCVAFLASCGSGLYPPQANRGITQMGGNKNGGPSATLLQNVTAQLLPNYTATLGLGMFPGGRG
jgi:hypothetical protein